MKYYRWPKSNLRPRQLSAQESNVGSSQLDESKTFQIGGETSSVEQPQNRSAVKSPPSVAQTMKPTVQKPVDTTAKQDAQATLTIEQRVANLETQHRQLVTRLQKKLGIYF